MIAADEPRWISGQYEMAGGVSKNGALAYRVYRGGAGENIAFAHAPRGKLAPSRQTGWQTLL